MQLFFSLWGIPSDKLIRMIDYFRNSVQFRVAGRTSDDRILHDYALAANRYGPAFGNKLGAMHDAASRPQLTSPQIQAFGAIQAAGSTCGETPLCSTSTVSS